MTNESIKNITQEINNSTSNDIVGVSYGFKIVDGKVTNEKSIIYTVKEKKPIDQIDEKDLIPKSIEINGEVVRTDVIEGIIKPHGYDMCDNSFYEWMSVTPTNRNKFRPLKGGISTTNLTTLGNYVGTLGFIAVDNDTDSLVAVSNNHVYVDDSFFTSERDSSGVITDAYTPSGQTISQPNEVGNSGIQNSIGILKKYQPLKLQNNVDVAICAIEDQSLIDVNTSWLQEGITGMTSAPRFATTQEIDDLLSDSTTEFYSAGRTTGGKGEGITKLLNYASNSSIYISYNKQGSDNAVFINDTFELIASGSTTPFGDFCYYPSYGGDSGSAILSKVGNEWVIVGLLYGGRYVNNANDPLGNGMSPVQTLCCRIDHIADSLNIRAWDGTLNGINFSTFNNAETFVQSGQTEDKTIEISGKTFWQMGMVNNTEFPADVLPSPEVSNTPTNTPTITNTPTSTTTSTPTPTVTPTSTTTNTPTPTSTPTVTPTVTNTQTPTQTPTQSSTPNTTPRETPTPTPSDDSGNRLVPSEGYMAVFSTCDIPAGVAYGYVNDTLWSTISGSGVSNVYVVHNTICYNLASVNVSGGVVNVPNGSLYVSTTGDIVSNCCPPVPSPPAPSPSPPAPSSTPSPPVAPGGDSPCYTYEITNNGDNAGDVTYTPCEGTLVTITVNPNETIFVCSEDVPQFDNQGFEPFGIIKSNFSISSTVTQPYQFITNYGSQYGNPDNVELSLGPGAITFLTPTDQVNPTLGSITFTINASYYWNSILGGCGAPEFYIYKEGDSQYTLIGSPSSWVDNQIDEFTLTYTDNNAEYDKYYVLLVSGCPWITYQTLTFSAEQTGGDVLIELDNLGNCDSSDTECGQFIIDYQPDGGCGENSTYTVTVSNIDGNSGPYIVTLNTAAQPVQTNGEDVVFQNVTSGLIAVTVDDISDTCDTVTKEVFLPYLSTPTVSTELVNPPNCFDCDGEVTLSYNGYTLPVTIEVYSGLTGNPNVLVNTYNNVNTNTYNITDLCGGVNYRFQVTGVNGCTNKDIYTVPSNTEVTSVFSSQVVNSDCGINDSISIIVQNNGSPITYYIESPGYTDSFTTTNGQHIFYDIPSGTYTVGFTTTDNCEKVIGTETVTNPDMYNIRITNVTDAGCDGVTGSFNLDILPGATNVQTPIDVFVRRIIDDEVAFQVLDTEQTSFTVTNLTQGTYEIEVIDVNGCHQIENQTIGGGTGLDFTVDATDCTETNIDGTAEIVINQSEGELSINWSNGETGVYSIHNLSGGTYSVTVTDDGCTLTKSFTIECPGDDVLGETTTVICSNTFTNQGAGVDTFEQLTENALNDTYTTINESCNYIPSYSVNLTLSNIDGYDDIVINQTIYVGENINDVMTNEIWTNSLQTILGDLAINHSFIASGYIFNQNFFRIESNCTTNELNSAIVNLRLEIDIDQVC